MVATDSVTMAHNGVCGTSVLATSPTAPAIAGMAMCQRRSPVRSEWRLVQIMQITAAA